MDITLILRTVQYLRPTQVWHQVKYRVFKAKYKALEAPAFIVPTLKSFPIPRYHCLKGERFCFLNLEHDFAGWQFADLGNLWLYNQNYFDWLNQPGLTAEEGCKWIDRFIGVTSGMAMDPYPIALRSINWVKFFCRYPETATNTRVNALWSQLKLLERKLEYHLLANHLLEDAYALYIGASFFSDRRLMDKARCLLKKQLAEQILPDGGHYEQSAMYHCILLDRLLDCINIHAESWMEPIAAKMVGWLKSICYRDGSFPLMNDAAEGIAPTPKQIFDYAERLGVVSEPKRLCESGYRRLVNERMEATVDLGNVTASYQPGHTHADALSYELRIDGHPFVIDTGISTYNKTERRQLERSTVSHNCVSPDGRNSSEVWGGFRVGQRAKVKIVSEDSNAVEALHDGFGKPCRRRFYMDNSEFTIEDWYGGEAVSYIHLAEGVDLSRLTIDGVIRVVENDWNYSTEYNRFHDGSVVEILFKNHLKYKIK